MGQMLDCLVHGGINHLSTCMPPTQVCEVHSGTRVTLTYEVFQHPGARRRCCSSTALSLVGLLFAAAEALHSLLIARSDAWRF